MANEQYILAIDQGTSSTKTLAFDESGRVVGKGSAKLAIHYENNFIEQSPEEIYQSVLQSVAACLYDLEQKGILPSQVVSVGLTNQRETFVLWDGDGKVLYNAISWQCKRSSAICDRLKEDRKEIAVKEKTGLPIDPYFSATKLMWLVEHVPSIATELERGNVFFGTVDTWILYRLTAGKCYLTDHTNASRTMLFNIYELDWDKELLSQLGLKGINLPQVRPSAYHYAASDFERLFSEPLPIRAVVGDSQAAALGAGCFQRGEAKATLGTGSSIMMAVGQELLYKGQNTVDAIYYSTEQGVVYAAEGIIVSCGATITWMKEQLGLFGDERELEQIASAVPSNHGITLIPAFSGMGTPYWKKDAKAAIMGLTFASNRSHLIRAALESVCFQIKDVITATEKEHQLTLCQLLVNGGMSENNFIVQLLADILEKPVFCNTMPDASALGCARLIASNVWNVPLHKALPQENVGVKIYHPDSSKEWVKTSYKQWLESVNRFLQ
ncbi:FGGY family carbohydrate kinase [Sphingobacterium chuzhouense]|uniref:ATP:glycerol 3-phosphotransferase n=1 Tax=Sphingobacterium chuzhouense TaxID=1742264 RepID=A0ABR7XMY4_9SPHI|nr:FGGY family carbohydrate kinase [Sphingobacterium chuzhouense]MBD1420535.1 carbohydrate kinase [Sphingobacterium chuzhouense]